MSEHTGEEVIILDAGSGCTFFPYYVTHNFQNCHVYCIDNDESLSSNFEKIDNSRGRVEFSVDDLSSLKFKNDSFDIIYCISVLEHTKETHKMISEFKRVLKNNGLLVLTFDISLDNRSRIPIVEATELVEFLGKELQVVNKSTSEELMRDVNSKDILTTTYTWKFGDKKLLPWRLTWVSIFSQLVNLRIPKTPFYDLTVFCSAWQNSRRNSPNTGSS
jgi:ubiquinone/menaquinone biosynthesis C-methylase UbiE